MSETVKHTPGPWRNNGQTVFNLVGDEICTCGKYVDWEHNANARLIAAAPELLAFAQMIANGGLDAADHNTIEGEARQLLDQATGETTP